MLVSMLMQGASFRNTSEILELSGCDKLTISPDLLNKLQAISIPGLPRKLNPEESNSACSMSSPLHLTEATFRWMLNEDQCATEKLSEGIRVFAQDAAKLEKMIAKRLGMLLPSSSCF